MYTAYIAQIKNLTKHSNADRLQIGTVFGNSVIVGLDITSDQLGVYFPIDGKLGIEYATKNNLIRCKDEYGNETGGYLDPHKRNIRALSLRGERSDGLFLPLESLNTFTDITALKEGDALNTLNGIVICEKYIPQNRTKNIVNTPSTKKKPKSKYPLFMEHKDTAQLPYNLKQFIPGDRVVISLKMHGTSQRTAHTIQETKLPQTLIQRILHKPAKITKKWDYVTGTRRTILPTSTEQTNNDYYGSNSFRLKHHEFFKDKLQKGETVYYEVVGFTDNSTPIMPTCNNKKINDKAFVKTYGNTTTFHYNCAPGENQIYAYRMTMTNEDGYIIEYPHSLVKLRCEQMGIKHVPEFTTFTFTTTDDLIDQVNKYLDGPDPIGKTHVREGIIARIDNREQFTAFKLKNFEFKVLEGIIKDSTEIPDMEEAEESIETT